MVRKTKKEKKEKNINLLYLVHKLLIGYPLSYIRLELKLVLRACFKEYIYYNFK